MPKSKKEVSSSDTEIDDVCPPAKKCKNNDGNSNNWILEKKRQVRINEFRGRKLIDIREYYEKDGEYLPGKKGISLSIEQWKKLLQVADEITRAVD